MKLYAAAVLIRGYAIAAGASQAYRKRAKQAMPAWADKAAIKAIYERCRTQNLQARAYGEQSPFAVDHIVPLKGRDVCGLHVEGNLHIILRRHNEQKGNRRRDREDWDEDWKVKPR